MRKIEDYLDIINLAHHESHTRKKMSLNDRAAQFAPFAALSGHGEEMAEVARLTSDYSSLSNELIEEINKPEMTFNDGEKPKIVTALFKNDAGIIGATLDN